MDDNRQQQYQEALSRMVRMETVSDPDGNNDMDKFNRFHELLKELFPNIHNACKIKEFDGSLLLRWKGTGSDKLPVLFMNHHDVVPAGEDGWKYPPFSGEIAEGKIWGRGTLDDKGGLWAMLQAADELAAEGFVPERDIYFESACTEETTAHGADMISQWLKDNGVRFEMVFDEGGAILHEPIGGAKGTFAMVGVGEKSIVNLKFTARSRGGHASTPGKNTPLVRLGKFMAYVDKHQVFEVKLAPAITEMLMQFAPYMGRLGKVVEKADKLSPLLEAALPKLGATANALVTTTIAFTMAGGGETVNVIPMEAWVIGDMRCSHHQGKEGSIAAITRAAKKFDIEVSVLDSGYESGITDYNGSAFSLVKEAVRETFPDVDACAPYIVTGASDARYFDRVCDQCIRFMPFKISDQQMESIHGINECLDLDTLIPAVDYYRYMMTHA
ncbi:MAG: M20/M25/M40 family metallo-hydrolase [Mogibacterium sp.]|nr:M20/M25/M40 family metallo-hydrolase [Mogibacterium sp.]